MTDSFGDGLEKITCLGFLKGSNCPHYDGEIERRPAYHQLIQFEKIQGGIASDDGVAVHYIEQEVHRVVSSRPHAKAYKVSLQNTVIETELKPDYLGSK